MGLAQPGDQSGQRRVPHQGRGACLVAPEQQLTGNVLCGRDFGEQLLRPVGRWEVQAGHYPAGRALVDLHELGLLHQLRHDLNGARAGADDGHPLTGEVVVVVPVGAVDHLAFVRVDATDVGQLVVRQRAGGKHHGPRAEALATGGGHRPHALAVIEGQAVDFDSELDAATQVELVDHALDVSTDLIGGGVGARPGRVLGERERVQQRRDVARRAGIRVVPPRAADAVVALDEHDVVDARLREFDGGADAGETGADDERVVYVVGHGHAAGSWVSSLNHVGIGLSSALG
jgi:hypothetical protein